MQQHEFPPEDWFQLSDGEKGRQHSEPEIELQLFVRKCGNFPINLKELIF
jgi:hypothetical protein